MHNRIIHRTQQGDIWVDMYNRVSHQFPASRFLSPSASNWCGCPVCNGISCLHVDILQYDEFHTVVTNITPDVFGGL